MSLLDHSFHEFDVDQWVNNFDDLTEPEYVLGSLDDLRLSQNSAELCSLLKKDSTYDRIVEVLNTQDMAQLFTWMMYPKDFIKDTEIQVDDSRYLKFLSELIPGYVLYRTSWDRNQLGKELRHFIVNIEQPYNRKNTRLKKCSSCSYNLTDLFSAKLTADNILDDTPVAIVCPHCNMLNYINY